MNPNAPDPSPPESGQTPAAKPVVGVTEIITAAMIAAVLLHLIIASAGGMFIFPWISGLFAVTPKPKPVKKESVEVEMVEPTVAEPPPPEALPAPPDQPPPPEAMPTPTEPQLLPPVLNVPAEVPERNPLPRPKIVAVNPVNLNTLQTNTTPYVPSGTGTGPSTGVAAPRYVQASFYQRSKPDYPYEARKRRVQGTVILEAVFSASGQLVSLETKESSGSPILDKAAKEHGTQNFYSTTGQAERVLIPVEYRLVAP